MERKKHPALKIYLISRWCYLHHLTLLAKFFYNLNIIIFQCSLAYEADISDKAIFAHPRGVIIHPNSKIGEYTQIYQRVTLGTKEIGKPVNIVVGANCILGANCCLLGEVKIGDNVKVGANSVVLKNVASNTTVVGVPAKAIKKKNGRTNRKTK